jgi:hypothetical protein
MPVVFQSLEASRDRVYDGDTAGDGRDEGTTPGTLVEPGEAGIGQRARGDQPHAHRGEQRRKPAHGVLDRRGDPVMRGLDGQRIGEVSSDASHG